MTIERVEELRDEYLGIKKQLEDLKNELKTKSDPEKKKKAEDLNREAKDKEKQLKDAIREVKESKTSTETDRRKAQEIEEALNESSKQVNELYKSIVESSWSSSETTSDNSSVWDVTEKAWNIFKKAWWWIWDQWSDIWNKDKWKENKGTNLLRTLWFAVTWVWGAAMVYKWVKNLFWWWNEEESSSDAENQWEWWEKDKVEWSEWNKSFWSSWFWKALKWLWFGSAAWGWVYFLGKKLKRWGNKDWETSGAWSTSWTSVDTWSGGSDSGSPTDSGAESKEKEPADSEIVSVEKYIPSIKLDMRYATTNNFTWQKIYENADAKLRYGTVKKLKAAQDDLNKQWYSIKIWDAYRPQSAQEKLRKIRPDSTLVAPPSKWSSHTKWNTVDITLVKLDGTEIPMPSEFDDDNKPKIDRDYSDLTPEQRKNAMILQNAMKAWFVWYDKEWWHYSDKKDYPMERGD